MGCLLHKQNKQSYSQLVLEHAAAPLVDAASHGRLTWIDLGVAGCMAQRHVSHACPRNDTAEGRTLAV